MNPWDPQSKRQYDINGVYRTLDAGDTQAGQAHGVVYAIEGNGKRESHKGDGWAESDQMYTLNTVERHAVVYDARGNGNGGGTDLTGDHGNRVTDYTAVAVYESHPMDSRVKEIKDDTSPTVSTKWAKGAADTPLAVCAGNGQAKPPRKYIVRRLTPLECCRLQGYPDGWTENLGTDEPTEEQIEFFTEVWARWAAINGTKPKSRAQVIKWLKDPQSDSAEYKAYGNSLAIPCSSDVLGRIAAFVEGEEDGTD